jgi:hypothetical protein
MSAGLPPGYTPEATGGAPLVVLFFRIYCGLIAFLCLTANAFMVWMFLKTPAPRVHHSGDKMALAFGVAFCGVIMLFAAGHAVGVACPRRNWMYAVGLVLLGLGVLSSCAPFAIALLIFWVKPEVRAWLEAGD